ncbi:tripeptidyl-peptidase 1 precursor [Cordyceps fumosorosea ARSEF 2679]|uniref:tripeptidyl-peptidase II n=1 Tax=Cordyceps fumosorosea (strain ARSEF 2679) TaxID=1081104 RepID=A0A167RJX9_CORFA|nr:tripeptidyl-peptidase 1 precursor [Cordyceps fumosorosea ARSEF 2679]OAA58668.1 tripeptidyl-peptidase 1 precursor [Cordyceps fumosorosea ARSEF 2679]
MAFLLPVLVATLAVASPVSQFVTKQALDTVPDGWQYKAAAPSDQNLRLHIRLKEENIDQLQKRTLEISDPEHDDYGKHLTKAEVDALTAPTKETVDSVTKWLSSHGVDAGQVESGFLTISVSIDQAQKMLNTDYGVYTHATTGRETVRTTSYSLPKDVHPAIEMVQPTTLFSDLGLSDKNMIPIQHVPASSNQVLARDVCSQEGSSTKCLRQNYNVQGYTPSGGKTTFGICGFLGEVPDPTSLSNYLQKYDSDIPSNTTYRVETINNGPTDPGGEGEADLDVQISVALVYPIETVFYSTGGSPPTTGPGGEKNEPYLDWLKYTLALDQPSQTYSISYGDDEPTVPDDYADAVCAQFMKLGARGVSVLTASGDSGAGGKSSCQGDKVTYLPSFPASCPWVTTVGGTTGYGSNEQGFRDGGGGFSNHFGTPDYQADAVKAYVAQLDSSITASFNASGRAYPDVAALYTNFPVFSGSWEGTSGGTSASTPTTASIIHLLNDYLVSNGKSPLGFLNPFLYKKGKDGLRDIAKGRNNVCGNKAAFPAVKGWDASTGLGVPDFGKLKALL